MSKKKTVTVSQWIEELGAEIKIDNTVSKKAAGAEVTKRFKPRSPGFDGLKMKLNTDNVKEWAFAEHDGVEYMIAIYQPKAKAEGEEKPAKTYYAKVAAE
jgi:hypothetical protein